MTNSENGRTEWPDLVGADVDEAALKINGDRPDLVVRPVPSTHAVTADYRTDRVWLWFDEESRLVSRTPRIG
ncbi:serine protease inhibitor [Streptacidiphilus sp. P02-A3a]|uniref:serine protease inhibitor n=1 Tax=Streptacidiphilus sp. P02-A3a TaxID=2704468 RepID=UPI0015FD6F85|nr:serine protease inhibitor [Streptacidiphilus sp. P02-A3a]QMU70771.1 hypothetical protein GXP74_23720 [Streptacidiphilus sp. P02-A3a]